MRSAKAIYFILVFVTINLVFWTEYAWQWMDTQVWIIPAAPALSFFVGLLIKYYGEKDDLAFGLIYGALASALVLILCIFWMVFTHSNM